MSERKAVTGRIVVIKPAEIRTIESKMTVREIEKAQLKRIESSSAWQEHQRQHRNAKLFVLGAAESSSELTAMEQTILKAQPKFSEEAQSQAPGQEVTTAPRAYGSKDGSGNIYSGHGHGGTAIASCNCGQKFKTDEEGNTSKYQVSDTTQAAPSEMTAFRKFGYVDENNGDKRYGR